MEILQTIGNFIKGLFTVEQWQSIMQAFINAGGLLFESTGMVLLLVILALFCTQMFKVIWERSPVAGPPEWAVHASSLIACGIWSWRLFDHTDGDIRAALAVIAWGITWIIATYGLGKLLAVISPRLYVLWQGGNRRRVDVGPPIEIEKDRRSKP